MSMSLDVCVCVFEIRSLVYNVYHRLNSNNSLYSAWCVNVCIVFRLSCRALVVDFFSYLYFSTFVPILYRNYEQFFLSLPILYGSIGTEISTILNKKNSDFVLLFRSLLYCQKAKNNIESKQRRVFRAEFLIVFLYIHKYIYLIFFSVQWFIFTVHRLLLLLSLFCRLLQKENNRESSFTRNIQLKLNRIETEKRKAITKTKREEEEKNQPEIKFLFCICAVKIK